MRTRVGPALATLGALAALATATTVGPYDDGALGELEPLLAKVQGFDTLYLRTSYSLPLPDGFRANQFLIYAAADGRVTIDLDSLHGYRWYYDGQTLHATVDPNCHLCEPLPNSTAMAQGIAYTFAQLRGGLKDVNVERGAPPGEMAYRPGRVSSRA